MPGTHSTTSVARQRLDLLYRQGRPGAIIALSVATICTLTFIAHGVVLGPSSWFAAIAAVTALRLALYRHFAVAGIRPSARFLFRAHGLTAVLTGCAWGALPFVAGAEHLRYLHMIQTMLPGFFLMAAIVSYGVCFRQYLLLLTSTIGMAVVARLSVSGGEAWTEALLLLAFAPVLAVVARRYGNSIADSLSDRHKAERLVGELLAGNGELARQNSELARHRDLIQQEEALARHVFHQLTLGGDHELAGIHSWNQSMGNLSGDLIQTAHGPAGETYVFLGDFTGHGLPAALGALPASLVFLAMVGKGLSVQTIARELNTRLNQLLPTGYFCCATLIQLAPDRTTIDIWNGGLPAVLLRRHGRAEFQRLASRGLPLGVVGDEEFSAETHRLRLRPGDVLYAYTDGLTEARDTAGSMWGLDRLEDFLLQPGPTPRLPALIDAVLQHVDEAPPSDDISIVEIEASPLALTTPNAA